MKSAKYHGESPFKKAKTLKKAVVFCPDDYYVALFRSLHGISLKVLLNLATRMDEEGKSMYSIPELRDACGTPSNDYVSQGIAELVDLGFIARHCRGEFWMNFAVFKPLSIELSEAA